MDIPIPVDLGRIAQDLQIKRVQVESVVQLLDEGNTVPFITRYRKERTGNLNEVVIREIQVRVQRLRELAERKETILKTIEAQGKLEPDLAAAIRAADNPKRLEDLYLPFKPKKRTKASDARERGLEPLAVRIWHRDETLTDVHAAAEAFIDAEKGVDSVEKVLEGVGHILAEAISEMATVRDAVRKVVWKTGRIVTSKAEIPEGQGLEFRDYFEYTEPISQIPPHRVLAINRGDKEGPLKVKLEVSRPDVEAAMFGQLSLDGHPQHDLFHTAAIDALDRLILPSMEREVRRDLTESAEKHAVEVFARNLGSLLLQPPIPKQPVLAIDPGFKNGCKVAVLDAAGQLVDHAVIYPHAPENRRSEAKIVLKDLVGKHRVGVVAIGNGTACRETEELIAEIIAEGTRFSQGEPAPETEPGTETATGTEFESAEAASPAIATGEPDAASLAAGGGPVETAAKAAQPESEPESASESTPAGSVVPAAESAHDAPAVAVPAESVADTTPEAAHQEAAPVEAGQSHAQAETAEIGGAPIAEPGDTLGNGSSGETHAAHEAHEPRAHAETPVEMLPPISGGAPDEHEQEQPHENQHQHEPASGPSSEVATDAAPAPAADSNGATESGSTPAVAASAPSGESSAAAESAATAVHFPVPDDWEPEGPSESAGSAEIESSAASTSPSAIEDEAEGTGKSEASATGTTDHPSVPAPNAPQDQAAQPGTTAAAATTPAAGGSEGKSGRPRPGKGQGKSGSSRGRRGGGRGPSGPPQPQTPPAPHPADALLAQLAYVIVNEAGASVYSTSQVGREELPDYDATLRGTISIGRRLQDPLSELVKIEPQNIGVGLYQHDVNPKQLKETLEAVIANCVNFVGVDLNTASVPLLRHVSGLNQLTARRIVDFRKQHGKFSHRDQLLEVEGIGPATFTQAAGFLKIPEGDNPLDRTWVHPESYAAASALLEKYGFAPDVVRDRERLPEVRTRLAEADVRALAGELGVGELTLRDIVEALSRPERDPRDDLPKPIFKKGVLKLEDLTAGMELKGTVLNVVDFGAFVDIGLKDSGLVHISQLANRYVKSPHDVVSVGDVVTVWVMGVDQERKRVSLTMVKPGTERTRGNQPDPRRGGEPRDPNRERQPGRGRRGPGRGPRPPGSSLTSPPVGAPSVAVLAEPGGRRSDHGRDHGPAPTGPRGAEGPGGPPRHGHAPGHPAGPRGPHRGPGGERPRVDRDRDRDRDRGPASRPPARPGRPGPPPPPLSKDALAGNVPLRTFGQLKQLWEARGEEPSPEESQPSTAAPTPAPAGSAPDAPPPAEASAPSDPPTATTE